MASLLKFTRSSLGMGPTNNNNSNQIYTPLHGDEAEKEIGAPVPSQCCSRPSRLLKFSLLMNLAGALLVTSFSTVMFLQGPRTSTCFHPKGDLMASQLLQDQAQLPGRVPVKYELLRHGLDEDDFILGNKYWANLFPKGAGLVLLPDEAVRTMRLPPSIRVPSVENRTLYEMAGYHSLHCLTSVRAAIAGFVKAQKTGEPYLMNDDGWQHLKHCLADARENILCNLDETLLVFGAGKHPGDGQVKMCKDLGPVNRWLEGNYEEFEL